MLRLMKLRDQKQLSQHKLAEQSGVSQQMISAIEKGIREPRADILYKLARALGVTMDELYGHGEEDPE